MAEPKSGRRKPPVIDLTARPATPKATPEKAPPKPAEQPAESVSPAAAPEPEVSTASAVKMPDLANAAPLLAAALGGGVLGAGLILLLAASGLFPQPAPDARLDRLTADISALQNAGPDTGLATLGEEVTALKASIANLPASPAPDLAPLEAEFASLSQRLDAIAAGASPADATTIADRLDEIRTTITDLDGRLTEGEASLGQALERLQTLETAAAAPIETPVAQTLVETLNRLQAAFAAGKPFAVELAELRQAAPDLAVPAELAAAAEAGLANPDDVVARFNAILPELSSAIPSNETDLQGQAFGVMRNLLAIRPSEEMDGDTPEAVLSRLEGALNRRDFTAASGLFAALPEPMRAIAGTLPDEIAALAVAEGFLNAQRALTTEPQS